MPILSSLQWTKIPESLLLCSQTLKAGWLFLHFSCFFCRLLTSPVHLHRIWGREVSFVCTSSLLNVEFVVALKAKIPSKAWRSLAYFRLAQCKQGDRLREKHTSFMHNDRMIWTPSARCGVMFCFYGRASQSRPVLSQREALALDVVRVSTLTRAMLQWTWWEQYLHKHLKLPFGH